MTTQRFARHNHFAHSYDSAQESGRLPIRPNVGLAATLVAALVAVVTLVVYYVL